VTARTGQFDLILMDCQMPVLDGFAASRRIRRWEHEQAIERPTPIVALTANAIRGDRQLCLDAGMNEYLSKPFDAQNLVQLIDRVLDEAHVSRIASTGDKQKQPTKPDRPGGMDRGVAVEAIATTSASIESSQDDPDPASIAPPPIDFAALTTRCMGNFAFAASLLDELASTGEQRVQEIAQHATNRNSAAAAAAAHSLKGAAGIVTAEALQSLAAEIEMAAKSGDLDKIMGRIDELRREMRDCLDYIPILRPELPSESSAT
jgi:Amt family ammonium transporter